jgi:hypothetical protein
MVDPTEAMLDLLSLFPQSSQARTPQQLPPRSLHHQVKGLSRSSQAHSCWRVRKA